MGLRRWFLAATIDKVCFRAAPCLILSIWRRTIMQNEGYVRVKEVAKILGVSPNTVRAWGADEKITEHRHPVNNYRLYKRAELEKLLRKVERSARKAK